MPRDGLAAPERPPIAILERLVGRALAYNGSPLTAVRGSFTEPRPSRSGFYGATAMVTLSEVVMPLIVICTGTAFPVGVVGSSPTPIWYSLTNCGDRTEE